MSDPYLKNEVMILEIAAQSLRSAFAAQQGGADRIELCMALESGGISPSPGLLNLVREHLSIPIYVLVRPRAGNFVYSELELNTMLRTIQYCKSIGVEGVVAGCLTIEDTIDREQLNLLKTEAGNLDFTFHRAFDLVKDPLESLSTLKELGILRILTSGQAVTAIKGKELIRDLQRMDNTMMIMPGSGIHSSSIEQLAEFTGCREFHASAKKIINTTKKDPGESFQFGSAEQWETDEEEVKRLKKVLEHLQKSRHIQE